MLPAALLPFFHKLAGHAAVLVGGAGTVAAIDFRDEITLGSVTATATVVAIAGLFTIRSKIAAVWRDEAAGQKERADRLQGELDAEKADRAEFERKQQDLRHALETQIAELTSQMKILEAKTDLNALVETIKHTNETTVLAISREVSKAVAEVLAMQPEPTTP